MTRADPIRRAQATVWLLATLVTAEHSGREIRDAVLQVRGRRLTLSVVAAHLYRLEQEGLVAGRWGTEKTASGAVRRRYYQLTDAGRQKCTESSE